MEPTSNTTIGTRSSHTGLWIVIVIVIVLGIIFFMKSEKTNAPVSTTESMSESNDKASLQTDLNATTSGDNEASMSAIDKEYQ